MEFKLNVKTGSYSCEDMPSSVEPALEKKTRKKRTKVIDNQEVVTRVDPEPVPLIQTNTPYITSYEETQDLLKGVIGEINMASAEVAEDIKAIRENRTMKSKYTYLANLQSARGTLLGQKISAIKEMNSVITKSHELDAKRDKETRAARLGEQDDVAAIEKMYDAFVNMPVGANDGKFVDPLGIRTQDMTLPGNNMVASLMGLNQGTGFDQYVQNMTEEDAIMFAEDNPAVKEVVKYNPNTGAMAFAYHDFNTNQDIPNIKPKDINMFIDSMKPDFDNNVMTCRNLNSTYPIIYDDTLGMQATQQDMTNSEIQKAPEDNTNMKGF